MTQHLDHGHLHQVLCFLLAVLKMGIIFCQWRKPQILNFLSVLQTDEGNREAQTFEAGTASQPSPADAPVKVKCGNSEAIFDILFLTEEIAFAFVCSNGWSVYLCV